MAPTFQFSAPHPRLNMPHPADGRCFGSAESPSIGRWGWKVGELSERGETAISGFYGGMPEIWRPAGLLGGSLRPYPFPAPLPNPLSRTQAVPNAARPPKRLVLGGRKG